MCRCCCRTPPQTAAVCLSCSTGAVLTWCPKDSLVRNMLGTLKSKDKPVDLKVYPVHVTKDGNIWTKLR
jgi:hypothetical protein